MGTMADKLQAIINSKTAIKEALVSKGAVVGDRLATYATAIRSLKVAGVDITKLADFTFTPTGTVLNATDGQNAIAELSEYVPVCCTLDVDSSVTRLVVNNTKITLRDNLILIIRTHLTLDQHASIVFNGTAKEAFNKDGTPELNIANNASFMVIYNAETDRWCVL